MRTLPDASIDCVLADLPYGTTACAWDQVIPFAPLWEQYKRVCKRNAAVVLFGAQPFTTDLTQSNRKQYRYSWYWVKNQGVDPFMAKHRPLSNVEDIAVFFDDRPTYNPQLARGASYSVTRDKIPRDLGVTGTTLRTTTTVNSGTRVPVRTLYFDHDSVSGHATEKPVDLLAYLIRTYSNAGDTVLDNTCGSASTGEAALREGRNFIGIELDPHWYEVGKARLEKYSRAHVPSLFAEVEA
jgi:DNA modification methylase